MVLTDRGQVYSWGCGGGGRLGHGDTKDRFSPTLIETLKGSLITQIVAGYWHSAALAAVPPLITGKMVSHSLSADCHLHNVY